MLVLFLKTLSDLAVCPPVSLVALTAAGAVSQVWWELEGPQVPLRPDCLAIVNNFAFLLGGEELGPDGEFHASSKVYRYDPRQNSWLRMADMSVPRSDRSECLSMNFDLCSESKQFGLSLGSPSNLRNFIL